MKIKEIIFLILAVFLIFIIFLVASESKKAGKNEVKIEQLKNESVQKDTIIKIEKSINNVKTKQQKIITNNNVDIEYRNEWLCWIKTDGASSCK